MRRSHLLTDILDLYRTSPSIVHHHLEVIFEREEKALDLDGVTREMFSCAISQLIEEFFIGHNSKVPTLDQRFAFNGTFNIVGNIINHAFVLTNYLPTSISPVILSIIGSGNCSDELLLS